MSGTGSKDETARKRSGGGFESAQLSGKLALMIDIDETIEAFRRDALDFDCKRMVLVQRKQGGERFEGPGYISQSTEGVLMFKIYVTQHEAEPFGHVEALLSMKSGELYSDDALYVLDAIGRDGTRSALVDAAT
jgi:hypothetical protein